MEEAEQKGAERLSKNARRKFIVRQIRSRGVLSYARLNHYAKNPSSSSIKEDLEFLNDLGFAIETVEAGGRRYLVDAIATHLFTKAHRSEINAESKQAIGIMAASVLLGIPNKVPGEITETKEPLKEPRSNQFQDEYDGPRIALVNRNPELSHLWTRSQIITQLQFGQDRAEPAAEKLRTQLSRIWAEEALSVFVDCSTTNDRLISHLRDLILPTVFSGLRHLSVWTNSRSMFETLGKPEFSVRAVVVGGSQLGLSESLAGPLSEAFMAATKDSQRFGMCFIGATMLDLSRGEILSDTQEEKALKAMVLERSLVRIICIDTSKIRRNVIRQSYPFSQINPTQVDLIITSEASEPAQPSEGEETADQKIAMIQRLGVPVLRGIIPPGYTPMKELTRGAEIVCRVPHESLDRLLMALDENESLLRNGCVELFLNAAIQDFLQRPESCEVAGSIRAKFRALQERYPTLKNPLSDSP